MSVIPKSDLKILNQEIETDTEDAVGTYRLHVGSKIVYLTIPVGTFDDATMCRPDLLISALPPVPSTPFTRMYVSRASDNSLAAATSTDPLPEVNPVLHWHPRRIDVLSLKKLTRYRAGVHQVEFEGNVAVAKIAVFDWNVRSIEREIWAYGRLEDERDEHPDQSLIGPAVLGLLTESAGGRVIGFLMEKVKGRSAGVEDLERCAALVKRVHALGMIHGDLNRYNFVVDDSEGRVMLLDWEHAEPVDLAKEEERARAEEELRSLPEELTEATGRGATVILH